MTESSTPIAELARMEYRLDEYEGLLESFREAGYGFGKFDSPGKKEVLIRHDVDLSVERALEMAELERELGVVSTYCFLLTAPVYDLKLPKNVRALERIDELGHDVALHFDTHYYWDEEPDAETLEGTVTDELEVLSRLVDDEVSTASFHVPPKWLLGRSFDEFTNTYAPPYFSDIGYVSDSSQKWLDERPFPDGTPETFQLLVHPGLWHPESKPMASIVDECRREAYDWVDTYFDPLSE